MHAYHGFQPLTAYLAVNYMDRFLYLRSLPVRSRQRELRWRAWPTISSNYVWLFSPPPLKRPFSPLALFHIWMRLSYIYICVIIYSLRWSSFIPITTTVQTFIMRLDDIYFEIIMSCTMDTCHARDTNTYSYLFSDSIVCLPGKRYIINVSIWFFYMNCCSRQMGGQCNSSQ